MATPAEDTFLTEERHSSSADEVASEDEQQDEICEETVQTEESEEPALVAAWAQDAMQHMDAAKVAELYMAHVAAADAPAYEATPKRSSSTKVVKSSSRPTSKGGALAPATTRRRASASATSSASASSEPQATFAAEVRCAVGVGNTLIWAAERDGSLVVRDSTSGKTIERLVSGHDWERILCIEPVGSGPGGMVWCGTEAGPILVFDRNRKLQLQARQHSGGVHCICAAPKAGGRGFVVSGGSDWRLNMWHLDGTLMKTLSGHTGGVRCALVIGMEIWTGSDDCTVRVWDAAHGVFQLETQPCRAMLSGHTGAVHCLLAHSDGVLSCAADGTVRVWKAGGGRGGQLHECLREVSLRCGPVYQLVPMGRSVWAAGADGSVHSLDGITLEPSGPSRHAHAGFVSGLCALPARTTRQCWSFSSSDGRACRWKVDELDPQLTSERAALYKAERDSLATQLTSEHEARKEEQVAHADQAARDTDAIAGLRAAQQSLMAELAANMEMQEQDVMEAERLRGLLREMDDDHREKERLHAERQAQAEAKLVEMQMRAEKAEAEAALRAQEAEARLEALTRSDANAQRLRAQAERLAMRSLVAAVRALGGAQGLRERRERQRARAACQATTSQLEAEEERERLEVAPPPAMTQPAGFWSGVAYEEEAGASLVSTAKSLDDLLASSSDLPTVRAQMPHGLADHVADDLFEDGSESI